MPTRTSKDAVGEAAQEQERRPSPPAPLAPDHARVLQLQASAGNRAVAGLLSRTPTRQAPARAPRDEGTMSEADIEAELDRNFADSERMDPSSKGWHERFERNQRLHEELDKRAKKEEDNLEIATAQEAMRRHVAAAERMQKRFKEELTWAIETLDSVTSQLNLYLGYYGAAYASFTGVLTQAKRDVEARDAANAVLGGVLIGTGLGLAGGAFFEAAKGFTKVAVEVVTEIAEAAFGKARTQTPTDVFTAPANLDPRLRSEPAAERILDAWRGLAKFNFTTLAMGEYQLAIQRLSSDLERDPTIERARSTHALLGRAGATSLTTQLDTMHKSLLDFWELSRHPLLKRNQIELEQDMWIRWIEKLPNDADERAAALDEDVIEDHLASIGVLGDDGRLGVDFGWNTTQGDTEEAAEAGKREGSHLDQIGRYGVVGDDLAGAKVGRVSLRDDLYEKVGKRAPGTLDPIHRSFPAVAWSDPVKSWQIVRVVGTTQKGLEVQAVTDEDGEPVFV